MGRKSSTFIQLLRADLECLENKSRKYMLASSLPEHEKVKHKPRRNPFRRDRVMLRIIEMKMRPEKE